MIKNRGYYIFLLIIFLIFFSGIVNATVCTLRDTSCQSTETAVLRLYDSINSHVQIVQPAQSPLYSKVLCCQGSDSLTCNAQSSNIIVRISANSNAHVEIPSGNTASYQNICYGSLSCTVITTGSCPQGFDGVLSLYSLTNSHASAFNALQYPIICCQAIIPIPPQEIIQWANLNGNLPLSSAQLGDSVKLQWKNSGLTSGASVTFNIINKSNYVQVASNTATIDSQGTAEGTWTNVPVGLFYFVVASNPAKFSNDLNVIDNTPPPTLCGNGQIDSVEKCDILGPNLNGMSCTTLPSSYGQFSGGTLKCKSDCSDFDVTSCNQISPLSDRPCSNFDDNQLLCNGASVQTTLATVGGCPEKQEDSCQSDSNNKCNSVTNFIPIDPSDPSCQGIIPQTCSYSENIDGSCKNAGTDSITVKYTLTMNSDQSCRSKPDKVIPCVQQDLVPFFSRFNFLAVLFALIIFYGFKIKSMRKE